jgi:hypothetical protein
MGPSLLNKFFTTLQLMDVDKRNQEHSGETKQVNVLLFIYDFLFKSLLNHFDRPKLGPIRCPRHKIFVDSKDLREI